MSDDQRYPNDNDPTIPQDSDPTRPITPDARQPELIGPYRIVEILGSGGMGDVYLAEQKTPIRRKVALKVIKAGMDTREIIARFESERQALALMDHPNIAKVFDAGATEEGRPYFAMELAKGTPITGYCDKNRLRIGERLDLFTQVCEGVQHAHQKAVIHRDLKPSNILVTEVDGKPVAKIIDFGVAKATAHSLTDMTMHTIQGQMIGTPEYMSPEQTDTTLEDIDTRTDVYALGVVLYEMLAGALPFDSSELRKAGFAAIGQIIREKDPSRPSDKVRTSLDTSTNVAASRGTDPRRLVGRLQGDLDWIVMRALEKDRDRRYDSPLSLAEDIRRHLGHEPVTAGPPGAGYRTRKFVRRHRLSVGIASVALVVLVAFGVTMAVQAGRIAAERDRANQEAAASEEVANFLRGMLGDVSPKRMGDTLLDGLRTRVRDARESAGSSPEEAEVVVADLDRILAEISATDVACQVLDAEILDRAAKSVAQLEPKPRVAGRLHHTLANTYRDFGILDKAETQALLAVAMRDSALGRDHQLTLNSLAALANIYTEDHRREEAEALNLEVLAARRRTLGDDHPETARAMTLLAHAYHAQNRWAESDSLFWLAYNIHQRTYGDDDRRTLGSLRWCADLASHRRRYAESDSLYGLALEGCRRVYGDTHAVTLQILNNYAVVLRAEEKHDEAAEVIMETITGYTETRGNEHRHTLHARFHLALIYEEAGRLQESEKIARPTYEDCLRDLGPDHSTTMKCQMLLANIYKQTGQLEGNEDFFRELVDELSRRADEGDDLDKAQSAWRLLDMVPPAYVDHQRVLAWALEANEATEFENLNLLDTLSRAYFRTGDPIKARETMATAIALAENPTMVAELESSQAQYESEVVNLKNSGPD